MCILTYLLRRKMQQQSSETAENNELTRRESISEVWELPSNTLPTRTIQPVEAQLELENSQSDQQGASGSATDSDDCRTPLEVLECAICLSEMEPGDVVIGLPCSHEVHAACFKEWEAVRVRAKQSKPTCPLCRASLRTTSLSKHEADGPQGPTNTVTIELTDLGARPDYSTITLNL